MTERQDDSKLLPCPHCGSPAGLVNHSGAFQVVCTQGGDLKGGCKVYKISWSEKEAREAWNTRAAHDTWQPITSDLINIPEFLVKRKNAHWVVEACMYEEQEFLDGHPITPKYLCLHDTTNDVALEGDWQDYVWQPLPRPPQATENA